MAFPILKKEIDNGCTTKPLDIFLRSNNAEKLSELRKAPTGCILSPSAKILNFLESKPIEGPRIITPVNFINEDLGIYAGFIGFGSPMWVWALEQLIAYGVRKFIFLGYIGLINPEYDKDLFLIPTRAVRDEGTSYHYAKDSKWAYPDKELTKKLLSLQNAKGSAVWTTDAMFKQTEGEIEEACKLGIAGFEMECSALFTVAAVKSCKIASIQLASDAYLSGKYINYYKTTSFDNKVRESLTMAINVLSA